MKLKTILLAIVALCCISNLYAQDKIYKRDGEIITAKVKEVGTSSITYKRFENLDGPTYTIAKNEVEQVKYENGTIDKFDEEQTQTWGVHHHKRVPHWAKSKIKYGNDIISVTPFAFTNDNVQSGLSVGGSYEHLFGDGRLALYVPVLVTVNGTYNTGFDYNSNEELTYVGKPGTAVYIMPGVKFYPSSAHGHVKYAIGASLYYATGTETYNLITYSQTGGQQVGSDITKNYNIWGLMLNNSLNIFPSKHIFLGLELGLGVATSNNSIRKDDLDDITPLAQFAFKVGYRF